MTRCKRTGFTDGLATQWEAKREIKDDTEGWASAEGGCRVGWRCRCLGGIRRSVWKAVSLRCPQERLRDQLDTRSWYLEVRDTGPIDVG